MSLRSWFYLPSLAPGPVCLLCPTPELVCLLSSMSLRGEVVGFVSLRSWLVCSAPLQCSFVGLVSLAHSRVVFYFVFALEPGSLLCLTLQLVCLLNITPELVCFLCLGPKLVLLALSRSRAGLFALSHAGAGFCWIFVTPELIYLLCVTPELVYWLGEGRAARRPTKRSPPQPRRRRMRFQHVAD